MPYFPSETIPWWISLSSATAGMLSRWHMVRLLTKQVVRFSDLFASSWSETSILASVSLISLRSLRMSIVNERPLLITWHQANRAAYVGAETGKMLAQPLGDHQAGSYKVVNRILGGIELVRQSLSGHRSAAAPVYWVELKRQDHPVCFWSTNICTHL